jgi:hypothetical protein
MTINIQGYEVLIDDEYYVRVVGAGPWHITSPKRTSQLYFAHSTYKEPQCKIYLHRFIIDAPDNFLVDHASGNTLDNRKKNLRLCNKSENTSNSKIYKNNTSGYKGVSYRREKNKWQAKITINYKQKHLGYYNSLEVAYDAYCKASIKYHGEFGRIE